MPINFPAPFVIMSRAGIVVGFLPVVVVVDDCSPVAAVVADVNDSGRLTVSGKKVLPDVVLVISVVIPSGMEGTLVPIVVNSSISPPEGGALVVELTVVGLIFLVVVTDVGSSFAVVCVVITVTVSASCVSVIVTVFCVVVTVAVSVIAAVFCVYAAVVLIAAVVFFVVISETAASCVWGGSAVVSMERSRNNRRRSMSRPYTYAGKYPAQNERFGIYGISKGKECPINISKMGEYEIRIPKSRILV